MKVELSRYKVKADKLARTDEWLKMLNDRMAESIPILDREEMKLEVIFREVINGEEYLYWFSVQGEHGESIHTSPHDIDKEHIKFGEECLDHGYGRRDAQPQVVMVPDIVARAMEWKSPENSAVPFERREITYYKPATQT
jgi:Family of unknown function (DUF6176)